MSGISFLERLDATLQKNSEEAPLLIIEAAHHLLMHRFDPAHRLLQSLSAKRSEADA